VRQIEAAAGADLERPAAGAAEKASTDLTLSGSL
jgi:hypothetical protein